MAVSLSLQVTFWSMCFFYVKIFLLLDYYCYPILCCRLQYFSRGCQAYQKVLREAIQGKKGDELKTEENKVKLIALKTTANINTIIKDFFHSPPAAKVSYTYSIEHILYPGIC